MSAVLRRRESGSALLVTVMLLLMLGLVGLAALGTTTRDQQVAGYQNRKKVALYAAEAGLAEAFGELTTNAGIPTVTAASIGDTTLFPYGQPSYLADPSVGDPIKDLGTAPFPGMALNLGAGGLPTYQLNYWRIRVEGRATGGSQARLEAVTGTLRAN
jgi:hypothetical protein